MPIAAEALFRWILRSLPPLTLFLAGLFHNYAYSDVNDLKPGEKELTAYATDQTRFYTREEFKKSLQIWTIASAHAISDIFGDGQPVRIKTVRLGPNIWPPSQSKEEWFLNMVAGKRLIDWAEKQPPGIKALYVIGKTDASQGDMTVSIYTYSSMVAADLIRTGVIDNSPKMLNGLNLPCDALLSTRPETYQDLANSQRRNCHLLEEEIQRVLKNAKF